MGVKSKIKNAIRQKIINLGKAMNESDSIRDSLAYSILRDLDVACKKDELLVRFYPKFGTKISHTKAFATMQKYLELTRPVCVGNLVRIGGANDGGYVMINPKINLLADSNKNGDSSACNCISSNVCDSSVAKTANIVSAPPPILPYKIIL